jgi:hypothetical protein
MEGLYPYHTRKFCPDHPNETPDWIVGRIMWWACKGHSCQR